EWRFARHFALLAWSRAAPRVGSKMAISRAMMPMTTSSSISVKPFFDIACTSTLRGLAGVHVVESPTLTPVSMNTAGEEYMGSCLEDDERKLGFVQAG